MIMPVVYRSHGLVPMPNTVPAAGGCSVLVIAMASSSTPTDMAKLKFRTGDRPSRNASTGEANNSTEKADPSNRASECPPTTERVLAVRLEGFTNTVITLEPRPAAKAAWANESKNSKRTSIATAANPP